MKLIAFICVILVAIPALSQEMEECIVDSISHAYEYPIKPGMPEWKQYSHAELLEMLQIPDDVLIRMSTAALLETCLNYPFISDIHAYENHQLGLRRVVSRFNGLQELLTRPEAGRLLAREYYERNPKDLDPNWSSRKKGAFKIHFIYLEMLLSQDEILSILTQEERIKLLEDCLSKYSDKVWDETYRSTYHWRSTAFLIGRILLEEGDRDFREIYDSDEDLRIFLDNPGIYTIKQLNDIVIAADLYMQSIHGTKDQYE